MGKATVSLVLEGDEFRWELGLLWWEHAGAGGIDGEWVNANVELVVTSVGRFSAARETDITTHELAAFRESVGTLLSTRSGTAELTTLEDETGVTIAATDAPDDYAVDLFVLCHTSPELRARELHVSTRALKALHHALGEAVAQFPVQTRPEDV